MPKQYEITIVRQCLERFTLKIEADSLNEATTKASEAAAEIGDPIDEYNYTFETQEDDIVEAKEVRS